MTGGQEVAGSNPASPTRETPAYGGFLVFRNTTEDTSFLVFSWSIWAHGSGFVAHVAWLGRLGAAIGP